jgi:hypothetical protein
MLPAEPRPRYRPSGRFCGKRLAIAGLLLLALSGAIAAAYTAQLLLSYHFMVCRRSSLSSPSVGGCTGAVHSAHLRGPLLAAALVTCCGLTAYVGYLYLDHYLRWRASPLAVGQLPAYIAFSHGDRSMDLARQRSLAGPAATGAGHRSPASAGRSADLVVELGRLWDRSAAGRGRRGYGLVRCISALQRKPRHLA